ncbi:MAG TPA: hypothetical protein VKV05_06805, partial [Terriglobales bacterium]|nr:hypothetical protein [Terriglobales bacterium]
MAERTRRRGSGFFNAKEIRVSKGRTGLRTQLLALLTIVLASGASSSAQTRKPVPWKRYCQPSAGFCFRYPASWTMLGEVFAGNGVVVAPPQKEDRALWDNITLALVAPAPEGDDESPGLNGIIEQAAADMRQTGQNFVTLQRQERIVDHQPAQMLKAQYRQESNGREWIEEVVFIEGPQNEIYSVALKCAPRNLPRLEPVLAEVLRSWKLPEPEAPPEEPPAQATPPAKTPPPQPTQQHR